MKKLKLLLAFCALLIGWSNASAYKVDDLTSAGWTQVTAASITGVSDNYYVLVDANSSAYVMSAEADHYRPCYKTINNPVENPSFVWILEGSDNTFNLKSASTGAYFKQSNGWNTSVGDGRNGSTASLQFTLSGGKYSIQCVGQGLVGHWNDDGAAVKADGENIAANKAAGNAPGFYLYSISKATYNAALVAARAAGVSSATKASPVDVTSYIQNADWSGDWGAWEFTCTSSGNIQWGKKTLESWNANNVVVKQVLSGVPNGLYKLTADVISGNNDNKVAYVYAVGDTKVSSTAVSGVASAGNYDKMSEEVAGNTLTADNVSVTGNSLTVGIDQSAGWIVADNFKLYYYGPTVAGNAIALPDGGVMAADTWYYFDIAVAGDNYNATATTLGDIVYTTDGSILIEDESGISDKFTAENNSLSVTRYYVKSSSAQSLVVAPASYSYEVSEASANVSYIQTGNTVTVSFTASTNDPGATLTQNYSGVTFDGKQIDVVPGANGFTFTVPENLTVNTEYTLAIPAEAIGYAAGSTYNAAQNITLKTPALFDGIYYFYNTDTHKYMSRGNTWGTQAITDDYGLPAYLAFNGEGKTKVQFFDNKKYLSNGGWLYADNATGGTFFVEAVSGGYKFKDVTTTNKYVALYDGIVVGDAVEGDNLQGTSNVWALETPAQYKAKDNATALANAQAAAAASEAGIDGITTLAALETELAANYAETAISITGGKAEKYQQNAWGGEGGVLNENKYVNETVNNLQPGLYRLTVEAFQRAAGYDRVAAAGGASSLIYAFAGSAKTQLKSVMEYGATSAYASDYTYEGKHYPNNEASAYTALGTGNYNNSVYVYVADAGKGTGSLTFGISNPQNAADNGIWCVYENFSLVRFDAKATPAEKKALSDAITAAEANTLGFENGEYAPYNNVDALTKLAAAKAIDPETAFGSAVVAATTALTGAAWTANVGEVNAVYGGDFTKYETVSGEDMPYGWNLYNGASNHSRIMGGTEGSSNAGLAATSSHKALLLKFNATYGESEGYTMPLKAGKIYKISFLYGGWGNNPNTIVSLTDPSDAAITLAPNFRPATNDAQSNAEHWYNYTGYFVSTTAGDYKLNFNKVESGQQQIVIADVELVSASELEFADGSVPTYAPGTYPSVKITRNLTANRWATAVYPFAVSGVDNIAVLNSYNSSTGELGFTSAAASTANEPFFMMSTTDKSEITLNDVAVVATVAEPEVTKNEASLKGAYTATDITDAEDNYVLSNNQIFSVGDAGATINPYRAYIQIAANSSVKVLSFIVDGTATGVEAPEVTEAEEEEILYNTAGVRVGKDYKGIVINQKGEKRLQK